MSMAAVVHVWWLQSRLSSRWQQPVDGGLAIRGRRIFGDNKMVRGFLVLPFASAFSFPVLFALLPQAPETVVQTVIPTSTSNLAWLGFACGFGFMFAELPNSFLKRQLGIEPGGTSQLPKLRLLLSLFDRVDSTLGTLLAASLLIKLPVLTWLWALVLGPSLHALFSMALYVTGVKGRAL